MNIEDLTDEELQDLSALLIDEDSFIGALDETYDQIVGTFKGSFTKFTTGKFGTINITLNVSGKDRHDCLELQDTEDLVLQFVAMRRTQKPNVDIWTTERGTTADVIHDLNYRHPQTGHWYVTPDNRPFAPRNPAGPAGELDSGRIVDVTETGTSNDRRNQRRTRPRATSQGGL